MALNKIELFDRIYREGLYNDFVDFAIFMQMTKRYSFFNSALILLQRPGALYIESEDVWEKQYERHVLPEATPIVVMQPFGPINFVYDFSDTYGDKVPKRMRDSFALPQSDPLIAEMLPDLIRIVNQLGIYYGEKDYGSRQGGQVEYLEGEMKVKVYEDKKEIEVSTHLAITVNKHSKDEQKATTILHEIGHILCGHLPVDKSNQRLKVPDRIKEGLSEEQKEFEAEKVCELICKSLGISYNNNDYLDGYLTNGNEPYFSVRLVIEAADKFMKIIKN
jgi:hypothetical protein